MELWGRHQCPRRLAAQQRSPCVTTATTSKRITGGFWLEEKTAGKCREKRCKTQIWQRLDTRMPASVTGVGQGARGHPENDVRMNWRWHGPFRQMSCSPVDLRSVLGLCDHGCSCRQRAQLDLVGLRFIAC